jgi:hypothetical protein
MQVSGSKGREQLAVEVAGTEPKTLLSFPASPPRECLGVAEPIWRWTLMPFLVLQNLKTGLFEMVIVRQGIG